MATKSDEKKTAGKDESKTTQTTKQAEEQEVSETVEERGETDAKAAASGGSVGAVHDGDVVGDSEDEDGYSDAVDEYEDGKVEGAQGTVAERNLAGDEYDTPWAYVQPTAEGLARVRTSDSDDPARSWDAQQAGGERKTEDDEEVGPVALVEVESTPGQTFRVSELPNRAVAEAAGINYDQWVAGLPVRADVPDEAPRRGIPA